jgi:hypothetical protein
MRLKRLLTAAGEATVADVLPTPRGPRMKLNHLLISVAGALPTLGGSR